MDNNNKWDELSLTEKSEIMKQAVANGITDLNEIKQTYNEYADGGSMDNPPNQLPEVEVTAQYPYEQRVIDTMNNSSPEFLERLRNNDRRSVHNPDGTSSTHVLGSADNIVFPEIMDVNGKLIDNRSMPWQSAMRYAIKNNDYIEFPTEGDARYFGEHYKKYFPKFFDNTFADGGKVAHDARYNHVTQIYQSYINQGVNPQTALELTNQKIAEKGWTGWVSGDNKRYGDVNSFTDHTIDQFNRLYPDSLKSNNFNQFFQGIEGGRTKYNPTPNIYRQHLLQTGPGVKKRINEYRRLQGQSPLSLVSPTSTPLPWEESILYNPQLPLEVPTEQPVIAADGGYLFKGGGKLSVQNQRAGYAVNYFMNKGLSKVAAAGLVGNLMRESRMDPNALNPDKYGSAHGLAQFRGARWKNLQKMYGSNPTFEQQLDYIWHELNTTHKKGLQMLKSSKTVDEAAKNAFGYYEFSKGPENAIAQMAKYNKKMGYNQANGYRAMNDGITNAWVAYGKANPNIKLQGLNVNAPVLGYNRTIPNYDFTSAVDGLNVEDSIANFSGETPKFQYDLFPSNPTNYGKPIDYSSIKHPEKKLPETLDSTEEEDNDNMGIFLLMNAITSVGSKPEPPLATYTPQRQNNAPFTVGISQSNSNLLDIPLMAAYSGRLYNGGGKEDIYDKSAKVGNKTYPARTMLINGKETPVFLADDNKMYAVGDDKTPFEIWSQYSLPEVTVTPSKNKDKITGDYYNNSANRYYDSSYDPNGFMDFMNAATLGIGNRLSVSQDARLVKDIYDATTGNKSWEDVVNSAVLGNEGIFDNPYANMALDIVVPTVGGEYKNIANATAKGAEKVTGYLNRNMGYWGDNLLSRTYGTMARRYGLPVIVASPSSGTPILNDIRKYNNLRSSKAAMDAKIQDLESQGFIITDDAIHNAFPFYDEVNDVQVPYIDNVIKSQVLPRMQGKQKLLAQTVPTSISVHPEKEFESAGYGDSAGLTFIGGDNPNGYMPDISVKRGFVNQAGPHEVRHRIDYIAPLDDEQKDILNKAYFDDVDQNDLLQAVWNGDEKWQNYDFSVEKPTTNLDVRQALFKNLGLNQTMSLEEQNNAIQNATDTQILHALHEGNGYSQQYTNLYFNRYVQPKIRKMAEIYRDKEGLSWDDAMKKARENWRKTRDTDEGWKAYMHRKANQVRKALTKVGAIAAPVAISKKKKSK